jgi:hypothetical protein
MSDYDNEFRKKMVDWSNHRVGSPPVYNPPQEADLEMYSSFSIDKSIEELCRTAPDLVLWISRNYPKAPDQREPLDRSQLQAEINQYDKL